MFVENLDKIDESLRDQFVEHEKDGVKGFIDKDTKSALDMAFHIKEEKKTYLEKLKEVGQELDNYKATESERIEKAKQEALDKARTSGDVEAIEKRYQEQMQDLKRRTEEETRQAVTKEFALKEVENTAKTQLNEIVFGLKPKDDFSKQLMIDHLKNRQKVEDGKIIYLNNDGGASSLDHKGLLKELQESGLFKSLSSYVPPSQGGGNINGTTSGSGAAQVNQKAEDAKKKGDLKGFLDASINFNQ